MSALLFMPVRGEYDAPTFDRTTPRELLKFFYDLECLFLRAAITSKEEKKDYTLSYVDFDTEQGWQCFPEYAKATASYSDFKDAILSFYFIYSLRTMEMLISDAQRSIISTSAQLYEFHMQFLAVSSWLIKERQLDSFGQMRSYIKAFQPSLSLAISQRLNIQHPDHDPCTAYPISDVYDAAQFVLENPSKCGPRLPQAPLAACVPIEASSNESHSSDFASATITAIDQTAPSAMSTVSLNVASTVSQPEEPLHYSATSSIAPVTQDTPDIPLHDYDSLALQRDTQRPEATPLVSTTSTIQQEGAHSFAHLANTPLSASSHLEPIHHSPTVYSSPAQLEIQECELDMPITITQDQLMLFSPDARAKIQHLVAARQTSALSTPHIVPVTSHQLKHDCITAPKAAQPILRSRDQAITSDIRTSAQEEEEEAYIALLPVYKAPQVEITNSASTIICICPIESYIQSHPSAPARLSQIREREVMPRVSVPPSARFALSSSSSPSSIAAHIVAHSLPQKLALEGLSQRSIYDILLAILLSQPLRPSHFSHSAHPSSLSSANLYIVFLSQFLHVALERIPQHPIPIKVIIYPPCRPRGLAHF